MKDEMALRINEISRPLNLKTVTKEQTSGTFTTGFKIHPFTFRDD